MSRRQKRDDAREAARQKRAAAKARLAALTESDTPTAGDFELRTTSDVRLFEKALRQGWKIPPAIFAAAPLAMAQLMADKNNSPRTRIAATRTLAVMHGQNLDQEENAKPVEAPAVNVQVAVGVQVAAVKDRSDDELQRFLDETAGARGVDEPALGGHSLSNGALSAFANGATVRVPENGKH